jgi:uncharacterized protein YdaU (DUF1376 family)
MSRWYKRCGADFIHGTMSLTLEEKGAFSLCLDLIYDRAGPIPDDDRWLAGVCGVSARKWRSIRARLIGEGKLVAEDGHLSNPRAASELLSLEISTRERAENSAKGGRTRAENAPQLHKYKDLGQVPLHPIDKRRKEQTPHSPPPDQAPQPGDEPQPAIDPLAGKSGKSLLPPDWEVPPIAELPPRARACAEQWTSESYATRGEEFVSFWRSRGRMMRDWRLTWAGRVVAIHSQVMRDEKSGIAPDAPKGPKPMPPLAEAVSFERQAALYDRIGRPEDAEDCRRRAARLRAEAASPIQKSLNEGEEAHGSPGGAGGG